MTAAIHMAVLTLAQSEGPGRGDNPSEAGGFLIIAGVIVLAVLVIGTAWYLVARVTANRRDGERRPGREG